VLISSVDGVYKTGVATKQAAYEAAVVPLFDSLDRLEQMLIGKDYLVGDTLTEADIRLWVTIVGLMIIYPVLLLICAADSFRPRLFWSLQVQLAYDPKWVSRYPFVRRFSSAIVQSTLTTVTSRQLDEKIVLEEPRLQGFDQF
jgi:glutathione S-transferase